MTAPGERLPVVIRALRLRDVPGLLRMRHGGVRLDLSETSLGAYTPLKGLAQSRWAPVRRRRVRTYAAFAGGALAAFVQARDRPGQHKWDIMHLGAAPAGHRVELWTALLDYATAAAGRRGVQRLYAKLPSGAEAAAAFDAAGYGRYGRETIYLLPGRPHRGHAAAVPTAPAVSPRPQARGDTWALHQLYHWTAPKATQYAEAYTSHHWELPKHGFWPARGGAREWGFIVERGHEIAIYCRIARQGRRSRLEFIFDPHGRELLGPTVEAMLRWLSAGPGERVYCAVREFQEELGGELEARGFEAAGMQDLLVRYTTARAARRSPAPASVPALERVRAAVPTPLALPRQRQRQAPERELSARRKEVPPMEPHGDSGPRAVAGLVGVAPR